MNTVTVSAPGKLMLFGEHAVVYNRPCLVTAVSARIKVTIERTAGGFKISAPQVKDVRFVEETVRLFQKKFKIGNGLAIQTKGDFSCQYGFGSSSAVTVATLKGLSQLFEIPLSKKEIFDLGYQVTLTVQGLGSGFDIAAATYGGILYFVTGGKKIEPLKVESLPLVVGYSGKKADTPSIVKNLKLKMKNEKRQIKIKKIFNKIAETVELAREKIENGNWPEVGVLMNQNQKLLQELGVNTPKLDKMCQAAVKSGAWGAKLSGAGGGDCMITLVTNDKRKAVEEAIKAVGGKVIRVKTCAEGVRDESNG